MASPVQKNKAPGTEEKKTGKKADSQTAKKNAAPRVSKAKDTKPPAYMQAKLAISHPGDSAEKEADHVAQQVVRATRAAPATTKNTAEKRAQRASLEPAVTPGDEETLALKPVSAAQNIRQLEQPSNTKMQPDSDEGSDADSESGTTGDNSLEARIAARRGAGSPLPSAVAAEMASRFNHDFNSVRIHTDREAADLCAATSARAFTVGSDIFFATGEFAPDTDDGKELLAHELTHVVQQNSTTMARLMRCTGNADAASNCFSVTSGDYASTTLCNDTGNRCMTLPKIRLPHLKHRNAGLFSTPLHVSQTPRPRTNQTANFRTAVNSSATLKLNNLITRATNEGAVETTPSGGSLYFFTLTNNTHFVLFGNTTDLLPRIEIPIWDAEGHATNFQVDHILEMQLRGTDDSTNYELLEGDANMGAGRAIAGEIRDTIKGGLDALKTANPTASIPSSNRWYNAKRNYDISYASITWDLPHDGSANGNRCWSLNAIQTGLHTDLLRPMTAAERAVVGSNGTPTIYASAQGGTPLNSIANTPNLNWAPRIELLSWTPSTTPGGDTLGTLTVSAYKASNAGAAGSNKTVSAPADYPNQAWVVKHIPGMNAGYIDPSSYTVGVRNSLRLPGMSPIELDEINLTREGIIGSGRVLPTLPLIQNADIRIAIHGAEVMVYKTFSMEEVHLPSPFNIDSCDLTVFFSNTRGLGIEGRTDFGIDRVGSGFLGAAASTGNGFELAGGFDFDSQLFDQAHIGMAYRNEIFSAEGDLAINSPNKVRGIRSAHLHINYEGGAINATGSVQPNIPGVQQADLHMSYDHDAGLTIGGNLQLAPNPAIRSGSVDVTVRKVNEQWKVAATGTAQPAIPGINSQLAVSYDDGTFTAEFSGAFSRGMLSGNATVGATNRAVGADGRPSGAAAPHAPIVVYGSGSATIRIAPWLQGTAGIRFAPNGEVTVSGEIGLPDSLEIFSVKEINKQLFGLSTQIPIFPGIVAEVGGNLSAHASIGPGALDQCRIGIEYNPSHEENTHVTGDAHLNIPAEAGLRLAARAGIGLGITGASATGGLELGGTLGISGAAEAGVHIDWMPGTGLAIDAEGYLHASPKFKFDVSGYVAVTALGFSVYDHRWELAAYELGSDMNFGVRFPIHYREGQPFNVSLDDVRFEVPDVNPTALVRQLGDHIFA